MTVKNWDETVSPSYISSSLSFALTHIRRTLSFSHSRSLLLPLQERDCGKKLFYLSSPTRAFVCKMYVYMCLSNLHVSFCMCVQNTWKILMSDYKEIRQLVNLSNRQTFFGISAWFLLMNARNIRKSRMTQTSRETLRINEFFVLVKCNFFSLYVSIIFIF